MSGAFLILVACVLILISFVVGLSLRLVSANNQNSRLQPFHSGVQVDLSAKNKLFTNFSEVVVDFVAIGLPHRKETHFNRLQRDLDQQGFSVQFFQGLNGKMLNLDDYAMTARYRNFFDSNNEDRTKGRTTLDYRGHLGCTLSHLTVIENIRNMTVILEDDADIVGDFRLKLQQTIVDVTRHDPHWEILILGCSAKYKDHPNHKLNDVEPIYKGGIVKLHFWIGLWGYVVRNQQVAEKILHYFNPLDWHIDITIAEQVTRGNLKAYGRIPPIVNHPGLLRISSWDTYQLGDVSKIKSDTNQ
jgi:GR25 family glycosyltransferase involved in LPS biosynthesis